MQRTISIFGPIRHEFISDRMSQVFDHRASGKPMHEASIADSVLQIALSRLEENGGFATVSTIDVAIGELRNVDPSSLQFAFDAIKPLYPGCSHCQLRINNINSLAYCRKHGHEYHPTFADAFRCPACGAGIGRIVCGEELNVVNITFETD